MSERYLRGVKKRKRTATILQAKVTMELLQFLH